MKCCRVGCIAGFAFVALMAVAVGHAWAAPTVLTLDNGLRLAVEEDHSAPVATVYFYVGTGSNYEAEWLGSGLSHILEHCVYESGTTTRTRAQIEEEHNALGNSSNAWTSQDTTAYYITTTGPMVLRAADLLADQIFHAALPEDHFKTEQGIILREMARSDDDPNTVVWQLSNETLFRVAPERHRIIGYPEQFRKLTQADMAAYYARAYVPENVVVSVVGDFSAPEIIKHLREVLGKEPQRAYRKPVLTVEPPPTAPRRGVRQDARYSRTYMIMSYPSVTLYSPDMYPLDVAAYILAHGDAARLVAKLRDEQGLVDTIEAYSLTPAYEAGSFAFWASMDPGREPQVEQALLAEITRLRDQPVTATELARAKRQKEAELIFSRATIEGKAAAYGADLLNPGDINFGQRYVAGIRQVTAADIQRVVRKYLRPEFRSVALVGPPAKATAVAATAGPAQETKIQRAQLPNGLRLLVQENHSVPMVNLFFAAPGGLRYENDKTAGLTSLMAQMLVRGTKTRDRLQIAQALEDVGGSLGPYSGRNSFGVAAQTLSADLPRAMALAAEVLRHPTFPAAELAQEKQQILAALASRPDDVDTYASDLMLKGLFPQHPFRFPSVGSAEVVKAATKADLFAWHKRLCRPEAMVLAVFGDTTMAAVKAQAERWFGDWPATGGSLTPAPAPVPLAKREEVTEVRSQQQAVITYGFPGPRVDDPERYQRDVMMGVFAGIGGPAGRLHPALRGAELVYADWAYDVAAPEGGFVSVYAGTAPDKAAAAREKIEAIIRDLQASPPSAAELALAKVSALTNHATGLQSSAARAQNAALDELMGLGAEEMFRYTEGITQVTAEQVQAQARKWLNLERCVVVVTRPQ